MSIQFSYSFSEYQLNPWYPFFIHKFQLWWVWLRWFPWWPLPNHSLIKFITINIVITVNLIAQPPVTLLSKMPSGRRFFILYTLHFTHDWSRGLYSVIPNGIYPYQFLNIFQRLSVKSASSGPVPSYAGFYSVQFFTKRLFPYLPLTITSLRQ